MPKIVPPLRVKAVAVDLDGTMLDTVEDLAIAVNMMLERIGRAPLDQTLVRNFVGKGINNLVERSLVGALEGKPDPALLEQAEEEAVASALAEVERALKPALAAEDFAGAMAAFAGLRVPIDAFFDKVTVNVTDKPELRLNRLKLLNQIRATMDSVADFSKIEG